VNIRDNYLKNSIIFDVIIILMKALGIDPGTATTGYGILELEEDCIKVIEYGCIKTSSKEEPHERLTKICKDIKKILSKHKPTCVAIERLFFGANTKTAMAVGQARGVILLAASQAGVEIAEYTPLQVKIALTGYGRADKNQMQQMVKRLLKLDRIPKPDDAADALAIALCHINSDSFNSKVSRAYRQAGKAS
jgi:crossover junction endodeoxyribonuclease RuvC